VLREEAQLKSAARGRKLREEGVARKEVTMLSALAQTHSRWLERSMKQICVA